MRKIEFRGKCVTPWGEAGSWHFGSLLTEQKGDGKREVYIQEGGDYYIVEPKTVGEYTGVVDNYGSDIYEGDIILIDGNVEEVYIVELYLGEWALIHYDGDGFADTVTALNFFKSDHLTVIDNIHDRKERVK